MYSKLLKEVNGDHKYLRRPDIWYSNFEVIRSSITLDKVDLVCAENLKYKPTGNDSVFIDHSNTIDFSGIWLDISGYLITQWRKL